jgi:hypothetical protein
MQFVVLAAAFAYVAADGVEQAPVPRDAPLDGPRGPYRVLRARSAVSARRLPAHASVATTE